ncbi:hypothetical protein [Xanthomonas sp. SI]|uniref:hypothetical protein n=1 Tax=Xanthomonas sp. SI TaxID=2724123 RepID=UPI00163B0F3C|nr:hypothetical protein [Xanthomonas sp. SI]
MSGSARKMRFSAECAVLAHADAATRLPRAIRAVLRCRRRRRHRMPQADARRLAWRSGIAKCGLRLAVARAAEPRSARRH